jgi:hypothetical protein
MRLLLALLVLTVPATASAETCKYVDSDGHTIYSNVPIKNARKVTCFHPPTPVAQEAPAPTPPAAQPPADSGKARVDAQTQRKRDDERRRILEDELTREQSALTEARRALSEQESLRGGDERNYQRVQERLKPFQDAVETHEKNIASIRREISTLR